MSSIAQQIFLECAESYIPKYTRIHDFFRDGFDLTTEDRLSRFDMGVSPWIETFCDWFEDAKTTDIFLIQASQTAKTSAQMGALLYISKYLPGAVPVLWAQSTEDEAKSFVSGRLWPFLDEANKEDAKAAVKSAKMKQSYFRIFNSSVKVGYGTAKASLRSKPCRFVIGDEVGIWTVPLDYVKKRTRTFAGKRKHIFATTPPDQGTHFSWQAVLAANFYQWWVPCLKCGEYQGLKLANLDFKAGKIKGEWNYDKVREITRYVCEYCGDRWHESQKLPIIQKGKAVCVDPKDYKRIEEKNTDAKALQIPALYTIFTEWGEMAVNFLKAKSQGYEALVIYYTDELAEVPREFGDSFKQKELARYIDAGRASGTIPPDTKFITVGVDVQRLGQLYYVVTAWTAGVAPSGHVVKYGILPWKDDKGRPDWNSLLGVVAPYGNKVWAVCIDSSDGVVTHDVYAFVNWAGAPYTAIKDYIGQQIPVQYSSVEIDPVTKQRMAFGQKIMLVNSNLVKDEIATAWSRTPGDPGAWTFPADATEEFFRHLTNEEKRTEKRGTKTVIVWGPKYSKAPQHWFSSVVYATAGMQEYKQLLYERREQPKPQKKQESQEAPWINLQEDWRIQ